MDDDDEDDRISELESRITDLESEIKKIKEIIKIADIEVSASAVRAVGHDPVYRSTCSYPPTRSLVSKSKVSAKPLFNEVAIGKYLIGGLTSLLVFAAVIYLVTVFWNSMSNEVRFGLIMLGSLGFLVTGYIRVSKHRDIITSLIMGIGAGSSFIGLAAGHISLGVLSQTAAVILGSFKAGVGKSFCLILSS